MCTYIQVMKFLVVLITGVCFVKCQLTTDVLWKTCETTICGDGPQLTIQCAKSSKILINNITSGKGQAFDTRSYTNLRRNCLGTSSCDPVQSGFCKQHLFAKFNVSYVCVKDSDIDTCEAEGKTLTNEAGFITNPNYPSETQYRTCKWTIKVPPGHYVHIFLHEISHSSSCNGLIFMSESTCGKAFPTFAICDETKINTTISACGDTDILLTPSKYLMRFWLSYYVVPVSDLRFASLYTVDITCEVHKKEFAYSPAYYVSLSNNTETEVFINESRIANVTEISDKSQQDDSGGYGLYVGLSVGVIIFILIIVVVIIYLRCRPDFSKSGSKTSLSNCSDIQKRPLPERQASTDLDTDGQPILQMSYSVVADELSTVNQNAPTYAPTYAEIEECSETGLKPKVKLVTKKSVDNSKRELPAKPKEETPSTAIGVYSDIDINAEDVKDSKTEKTSVDTKNKKNQERIVPQYYNYKKKLSNASNIYAECEEVGKDDSEKPYMDMSHKSCDEGVKVPQAKYTKDKVNQSKKSQVQGQEATSNQKLTKKPGEPIAAKLVGKSKKESVTSESDSDDDISMVENELYEPFESAKV